MPIDIQGNFVSQKINKVRWIPEDYDESRCFLTGSWDDPDNSIKVWSFESPPDGEDVQSLKQLSEFKTQGDVTQIKFVEKNAFVASSSSGDVRLLQLNAYERDTPLKEAYLWKEVHKFGAEPCSCTTLDVLEGDIATVGEDGNINILNSRRGDISKTISNADSCSIHSVCFLKHTEIITGNLRGHMKIWDLNSGGSKPAASFLLAGDELAATCLLQHPARPHLLLAGSEAGAVAVWDLRLAAYPSSLLRAHAAAVTDMQLHPENPDQLLTCSAAGELWAWAMAAVWRGADGARAPLPDRPGPEAAALMPPLHKAVNALHADRGRVLVGTDNEAVYLVRNVRY